MAKSDGCIIPYAAWEVCPLSIWEAALPQANLMSCACGQMLHYAPLIMRPE